MYIKSGFSDMTTPQVKLTIIPLLLLVFVAIMISSCAGTTLENTLGVDPDDNAVLCATADIDATWSESRISYKRIELPSEFQVTPTELAALVSACGSN
jgi:hypothetical protein